MKNRITKSANPGGRAPGFPKGSALLFAFAIIACIIPVATSAQMYKWDYPTASASMSRTTGGCTSDDISKGITMDGAGNSYVIGNFQGTASFDGTSLTSSGSNDVFIASLDPSGDYRWVIQGKGPYDDRGMSIAVYPDGIGGVNTYATGCFRDSITFTSTNATTATLHSASGTTGYWDMYIVKYDNAGVIQWAMDCGNSTSGNHTIGLDIAVNNSHNNGSQLSIWVSGSYMGTMNFGPAPYNSVANGSGNATNQNGFLANYTDGTTAPTGVTWVATMTSTHTCQTIGVAADRDGNSYVTGYYIQTAMTVAGSSGSTNLTQTGAGLDNGFVAKFDWQGGLSNADKFGSAASTSGANEQGNGIAVDQNGMVYVCGNFVGTAASPCSFLGFATTYTSFGATDAFVMQLDNSCSTVQWVDQIGSSTADHASRVAVDNCGERCYLVGDFTGTCDFGNSITLASYGGIDSYLVDFETLMGQTLAATRQGTAETDIGYDVCVNSVEDILFCGAFGSSGTTGTSTLTFDPNGINTVSHVGGTGVYDGFVARWDHSDWPSLETTSHAINQGVASVDCEDYVVGDLYGTGTFGAYSRTSSNKDIYLAECDKYAVYHSFVLLTNGNADETTKDLVTDGTYHYVPGSAVTSATNSTVTFVNDPLGADNFTNTNSTSNAIVIKSDLAGNIQWAASVRPNTASSSSTGIGVAFDGSGNVYFCGYYNGAANTVFAYNAGGTTTGNAGPLPATNSGSTDIFVIAYSSSGAVLWMKTFGGSGDDRGLGISVDPSSSYYFLTGYCGTITFGSLASHTLVGTTDGYIMCGSLLTGDPVSDVFFSASGVADKGNDIYANSPSEVYVTGVYSAAGKVYIASYDLTVSSVANNWYTESSGGSAVGNDIILGGAGYVYVSGIVTSATVSFGSYSVSSSGAYIVGLASWNGSPTWISEAYSAPECNGLAEDAEALSTDHGLITLICGNKTNGATQAYLHKATQEGLELSSRYANNVATSSAPSSETDITVVYPNPFSDNAVIRFKSGIDPALSPVSVTILDVTGRVVQKMDGLTSDEAVISADGMTNGLYFFQVLQGGVIVDSGKMIVRK